jgi:hypothetical protein
MEKKIINTWQDVWKLPLRGDEWGDYAWSKNDTMALMFDKSFNDADRAKLIEAINETTNFKIPNLTINGCDFFKDGEYIFCVRGWGNLTGTGALNLSQEKALEIQDGFINHIYKILS